MMVREGGRVGSVRLDKVDPRACPVSDSALLQSSRTMADSYASFGECWERLRVRVESALHAATRPSPGCPSRLAEAIRYSLLAPGKRLRPGLVLLAAEACGGDLEEAMPAACAVEMIHAYSLIHDDLPAMDDDDLRRGRPTCHVAFDEATAILAGDALQAMAFAAVAQVRPAEAAVACTAELAAAAGPSGMVGGQADDVAEQWVRGDMATLESIHARKTGAMIRVALRLGGLAVQASPSTIAALDRYGCRLGLAFQVTDDLLDVLGDEEAVGKRVGKDAVHGKLTFPGLLGVEASSARAERLVAEAIEALAPLGPRAQPLADLAWYVLERDR